MEVDPPKPHPPKRKRHWFQFSLRSLLIFTLICAIPCAWLGRNVERKRRDREAVDAIVKLGGSVVYDYQIDRSGKPIPGAEPPGPDWLRKLLGENLFSEVALVSLDGTKVTDAGLVYLRDLTQLETLYLISNNVTDEGLVNLEELRQLKELNLSGTRVGDAGLVHLKGLTRLKKLWLVVTHVTDAGLIHLNGLNQLQDLELGGTTVTYAGVNDLQKALPKCKIFH
ncbi:MAG TPA: hypothetical protein VGY55_03800 [Pirellulales bacterium]|nr:hypothetical protein [Pirellulales bacterium]